MNARQKAKKLKKELDYLRSQPLREFYKVIDISTEHFSVYRVVPLNEIENLGEEAIENEARLALSRDLMKYFYEKIIVNKERYLDGFHAMKYSTDIWVNFGRR